MIAYVLRQTAEITYVKQGFKKNLTLDEVLVNCACLYIKKKKQLAIS